VEISFEQYERLLWRVLAHLAQRGYVVPPSEARDLIHDFYVEAWQGLVERFDPKRGNFSSYLFGAFYRFARRRILLWQNWRSRVVNVRHLVYHVDESTDSEQAVDLKNQLREIRDVLSRLPQQPREVLRDFLSEEGSERCLALKHRISRHRLREILIDALGWVAMEVGHRSFQATVDGQVALALWRDGRTAHDTATLLGIPVAEVHAARKRITAHLLDAIRSK
jgi:RNA polymerase sigma factor (sigma-70 family)